MPLTHYLIVRLQSVEILFKGVVVGSEVNF